MPAKDLLAILPCLPIPLDSGLKLRLHNNLRAITELGQFRQIHVLALGPDRPPSELLSNIGSWQAFGGDHTALQAAAKQHYSGHPGILATLIEDPTLFPLIESLEVTTPESVIIDMHNIESELALSISEAYPKWRWRRRAEIRRTSENYRVVEDQVLASGAKVWVCSEIDRTTLEQRCPFLHQIDIVPNIIWDQPDSLPSFQPERLKKALYAGTYSYYPNRQAANFICTKLTQRLGDIPNMEIKLIGSSPKRFMHKAARRNSMLHVTGRVPDMEPYLETCGIQLMPIFRGGGTRLKAIEASLRGLVIVSTPKAVEGLDFEPGVHYVDAVSAAQFKAGIRHLIDDTGTAERLRNAAFNQAREKFTHPALLRALSAISLIVEQ